jgi:hypothetical protein
VDHNRTEHERWLAGLSCPVLRLDGTEPVDALTAAVAAWPPGAG